jgi:aryl-alcohol dehydrogenase-like predicted oxidoreductase
MNVSRQVGRSGLRVSPIGLGTATFGREVPAAAARELVAAYLDGGGNHIDVADSYAGGRAESIVGDAIAGRRDDVVLSGKVGLPLRPGPDRNRSSRRHIRSAVDGSLARLRTDHLDVLHLHRWDGATDLDETLAALDDLIRQGKVDHVAVSNFSAWQTAWTVAGGTVRAAPIVVQARYSLVERDAEREILPYCRWAGLGFVAYSPLCGGLLTGKYDSRDRTPGGTRAADPDLGRSLRRRLTGPNIAAVAVLRTEAAALGTRPGQLAIAWLLRRSGVTGTVVGVTRRDQLDEALAAVGLEVDVAVLDRLAAATEPDRGYPYALLTELDCDGPEVAAWS